MIEPEAMTASGIATTCGVSFPAIGVRGSWRSRAGTIPQSHEPRKPAGGLQPCHSCLVSGTGILTQPFDQIPSIAFGASLEDGEEKMSQKVQPSQSGSSAQEDQKAAEEQRTQKGDRDQSKVGKPEDTKSSSNSMPGSGAG